MTDLILPNNTTCHACNTCNTCNNYSVEIYDRIRIVKKLTEAIITKNNICAAIDRLKNTINDGGSELRRPYIFETILSDLKDYQNDLTIVNNQIRLLESQLRFIDHLIIIYNVKQPSKL